MMHKWCTIKCRQGPSGIGLYENSAIRIDGAIRVAGIYATITDIAVGSPIG